MRASRAWLACLLMLPAMACQSDRQESEVASTPTIPRELGVDSEQLTADALAWLNG